MVLALSILQVVVCIALIVLVLLHSGKGGGVSDIFGGAATQAGAGSTVVESNLNKITLVVALVFVFNTLILGLLWT
ncbi:MAG: preprotein translocase subunit SecG [Actinomycetota bacterium]